MDTTQIVNEFLNLIANTFNNPVLRLFLGVYGAFSVIFVIVLLIFIFLTP